MVSIQRPSVQILFCFSFYLQKSIIAKDLFPLHLLYTYIHLLRIMDFSRELVLPIIYPDYDNLSLIIGVSKDNSGMIYYMIHLLAFLFVHNFQYQNSKVLILEYSWKSLTLFQMVALLLCRKWIHVAWPMLEFTSCKESIKI